MNARETDRIGLWAVALLCLLATAMVLSALFSAPKLTIGEHHGAPRVTPAPVAGSAGSRTTNSFVTDAERRMTPARSVTSGPIGFDLERETEVIVQAVSVRFEQLATPNCKRQRSFRSSHRGLNGAERARLSSSASVSTPTRDRTRHPASAVLNSAGGGGPKAPGYRKAVGCRKADYARERTFVAISGDQGSIPCGSTHKQPTENQWISKNQASAESFTTTRAQAKKNHGQAPSRKCTATSASTWLASIPTEANSANRARRTAKNRASIAAGFGRRASKTLVAEQSAHLSDPRSFENRGFDGLVCVCAPSSKSTRGSRVDLTQPGCQMYSGVPGVVTVNGTRKGSVASSIGKNLAIIARRKPTVTLDTPREGAKPSCSASPINSERAQQYESAGRPASEDDCASGSEAGQSAAEQPAMNGGAT